VFTIILVIYSKILNFASEEVILQLFSTKRMAILLYGLESCKVSNGDLHSLDLTYNEMCMKTAEDTLPNHKVMELQNYTTIFYSW